MDKKSIKNYVCNVCLNQLKDCECEYAPDTLIQIDERMQYAIRTLNYKGWVTNYCCEGHWEDNKNGFVYPYIQFELGYNLPSVPIGWTAKKNGGHFHVSIGLRANSKTELNEKKKIAFDNLNTWVDDLENNF